MVLDQTGLTIPLLLAFFPFMSWCEGKEDLTTELKEKILMTYAVRITIKLKNSIHIHHRSVAAGGCLHRQSTSSLSLQNTELSTMVSAGLFGQTF